MFAEALLRNQQLARQSVTVRVVTERIHDRNSRSFIRSRAGDDNQIGMVDIPGSSSWRAHRGHRFQSAAVITLF